MIVNVNIKAIHIKSVIKVFEHIKPDLIDNNANYIGAYVTGKLVGIVSYVEHPNNIYLGHAFVLESYRNKGIYNMLVEYRERVLIEKYKGKTAIAHCNTNSLKQLLKLKYGIDKALFKVTKII